MAAIEAASGSDVGVANGGSAAAATRAAGIGFGSGGGSSGGSSGGSEVDWEAVEVAWANESGEELRGGMEDWSWGIGRRQGEAWVRWLLDNNRGVMLDGCRFTAMAQMQIWLQEEQ